MIESPQKKEKLIEKRKRKNKKQKKKEKRKKKKKKEKEKTKSKNRKQKQIILLPVVFGCKSQFKRKANYEK